MKLEYTAPGNERATSKFTNIMNVSLAKAFRFKGILALIVILFAGLNSSYSQAILPTNSSPEGANAAPVGWTILVGSTDISNKDFWAGWGAYAWWDAPVVDPPNTHTVWVTGFYTETVGTTITGLTIGVEYNMNFYMCETRSNAGGAPTIFDGTLQATIGGVDHLFPFTGGVDNSWSLQTLTFTAIATSQLISFKYQGAAPINGNFWNISFGGDVVEIGCDELETMVSDTVLCAGEELTLQATSINGGTVTWDLGVIDGDPFVPPVGVTTYTATSDNDLDCIFEIEITVNDLPPVDAGEDVEICFGEDVILEAIGPVIVDYVWDLGVVDGVAFTPDATETYTVTGTGPSGCENTDEVIVTVHDLPDVIATASDTEICIGEELTLTGSGADSYEWDLGVTDGVTFTPVDLGTTTYTVIGTDSEGCENAASIDVNVLDLPAVTASVDETDICIGESITLTGGGADAYVWDMGATDGVVLTPGAPGTIDYSVIGTDAAGCENTATVSVNVHDLPTVSAIATPEEVCLGESVSLNGAGADTYTWDLGITNGVPFTPGALGSNTYTVTGTSEFGCVNTATITVTVVDCEPVIPEFLFENICIGGCIKLTDQSSGGTAVAWEWDFGGAADPNTSTEQHPEICLNTEGSFNISLTVTSAGGAITSIVHTIEVYPNPIINATLDTIIDAGGSALLIANTASSGIFSWEPENSLDCADCQITNADPLDSTMYTVTLIDEHGCSASENVMVLVNFAKGVGVPTAFTPNGDGNNDVLYVKGYGLAGIQFVVYNRYGEQVFRSTEQSIGWDGTFKNRDENPGVFTWVLHYDFIDGSSGFMKGNTALIR
tara:strand:- start:571 stop:3078 length:2508 start_codon:yes stop_codon:yes gene_type:complete